MSNQNFIHQLQQEIATVQATITTSGTPSNEAQTESLVIEPLLKALGYATTDYIKQQFSTVANNFPDYTLLPQKPQKWVLEVKRFGQALKPQDEVQTTTYGFHEATEWAVLTNGRVWFIYNIPLKSSSRRVLQIDNLFSDKHSAQLLACLSPQNMLQDKLAEAWNFKQVKAFVGAEMKTANSPLRSSLAQMVKQKINLHVTDDVMGEVLTALLEEAVSPGLVQPVLVVQPTPGNTSSATSATPSGGQPVSSHNFGEILSNPLLGTKKRPKAVDFGDGSPIPVTSWADAAGVVVSTLGSKYSLPTLPFTGGTKGKNYFLNVTDTHSDGGKMRSHRVAQVGTVKVYVDTHRSVRDMSACLVIFLKTINAPIDAVKINI